jgi:hypothetical protein
VTCLTAFDKVPRYVATLSGAERIRCVALKLWGVRCDQTDSIVTLEKARADRKKEPFVCEVIDTTCPGAVVTQVCVCVSLSVCVCVYFTSCLDEGCADI